METIHFLFWVDLLFTILAALWSQHYRSVQKKIRAAAQSA
jgi:hypothetical protein